MTAKPDSKIFDEWCKWRDRERSPPAKFNTRVVYWKEGYLFVQKYVLVCGRSDAPQFLGAAQEHLCSRE